MNERVGITMASAAPENTTFVFEVSNNRLGEYGD
jgi:secreted Zn-dependent insulinase-like peptidase